MAFPKTFLLLPRDFWEQIHENSFNWLQNILAEELLGERPHFISQASKISPVLVYGLLH